MSLFDKTLEKRILDALKHYGEYQVARMFNLRVAAVREVSQRYRMTKVQPDLFKEAEPYEFKPITHLPQYDYQALEEQELALYISRMSDEKKLLLIKDLTTQILKGKLHGGN